MPASVDRLQFAPPPPPGMLRAFGLAVFAHLLLMLALTWGISWNRDPVTLQAEAELWSSVPQEAAPKAVEPPPPPPAPVVTVTPPPRPEPAPREVDIALEREKKEREKKERAQAEERQLALEKKLEARRKLELARKKAAEEQQKEEAAQRLRQAEEARQAKRVEAQRQANLKRLQGLAGATGAPSATGTAIRSAGPSDSYAGRIRARVKPNIVFTEEIAGNPTTDVEVRTSPDGTIVGQRILRSSGMRGWDEAVIKAIIKTQALPRDVDGRVHSPLIISFRPKD